MEHTRFLLARGADPNLPDGTDRTPLDAALENKTPEIAQMLVEGGARIDAHAYAEASAQHDWTLMRWLVTRAGSTPTPQAIHFAVMMNDLDGLQIFLGKKADLDRSGALVVANCQLQEKRLDTLQYLLDMGADPNVRSENGDSPLHCYPVEHFEDVRLLLDHHADPNLRNAAGETPLRSAILWMSGRPAYRDWTSYARLLLDRGANPNAASSNGDAALAATACSNETSREGWPTLQLDRVRLLSLAAQTPRDTVLAVRRSRARRGTATRR